MNRKLLWAAISVATVLLVGYTLWLAQKKPQDTTSLTSTASDLPAESTEETKSPPTQENSTPKIYYPLPDYSNRVSERAHGQLFTSQSPNNLACGGNFTGYHTGDDLEVTASEINVEVPVFAVADGKVRQFNRVNGYGGLLVIEHTLNGEVVTANYGHVDLSQPKVKLGENVTAGQIIGYLGANCSSETDGERKHIHFAIHRSSTINIRGYLQNESDLQNWHNPKELLGSLKAAEPTI